MKINKTFEQWCIENNRQDVLDRWSYELNDCRPDDISFGTHKNHWFYCDINTSHNPELKNINRFTNGQNGSIKCNQCNSFKQWCYDNKRQDILDRWDYELNDCLPSEISYGTKKKFWFKCPRGIHDGELKCINSFTNGQEGSITCNACNSLAQWGIDNIDKDFLNKYWDYEINEFNPYYINKSSDSNKIWIKCREKEYHPSYKITPNNFSQGYRCPYCKMLLIHPQDSLGQFIVDNYGQDFLDKIWSDKNIKTAFEYAPHSNKYVYWHCENNTHEDYKREINDNYYRNYRCPKCSEELESSVLQIKVNKYLNNLGYSVSTEYNCSLLVKNPKTNQYLRFDNEIITDKKQHLVIEVHGQHHYNVDGFNIICAKHHNTTPEYELYKRKLYDRYKRIKVIQQGYYYLEIPYWTDDKEETWKQLIDNKINEIV